MLGLLMKMFSASQIHLSTENSNGSERICDTLSDDDTLFIAHVNLWELSLRNQLNIIGAFLTTDYEKSTETGPKIPGK